MNSTVYIDQTIYENFENHTRECSVDKNQQDKEKNQEGYSLTCRFLSFGKPGPFHPNRPYNYPAKPGMVGCREYFNFAKKKNDTKSAALIGYVHLKDGTTDSLNGYCLVYDPLGEM